MGRRINTSWTTRLLSAKYCLSSHPTLWFSDAEKRRWTQVWLQKGKDYHIAFVDPEGTKISDYEYKVDGNVKVFTKNTSLKIFKYNDLDVRIGLALYTHNSTTLGERYREFWIDTIERVFGRLDL